MGIAMFIAKGATSCVTSSVCKSSWGQRWPCIYLSRCLPSSELVRHAVVDAAVSLPRLVALYSLRWVFWWCCCASRTSCACCTCHASFTWLLSLAFQAAAPTPSWTRLRAQ
eukprot:scaffold1373_cov367-Pinguiococcus_pyrenoidosus.AAC.7